MSDRTAQTAPTARLVMNARSAGSRGVMSRGLAFRVPCDVMIRHGTLLADATALGHDALRMRMRRPKVVTVPGSSGPPEVAPEWPVNARDFAAYYRFAPAAL